MAYHSGPCGSGRQSEKISHFQIADLTGLVQQGRWRIVNLELSGCTVEELELESIGGQIRRLELGATEPGNLEAYFFPSRISFKKKKLLLTPNSPNSPNQSPRQEGEQNPLRSAHPFW